MFKKRITRLIIAIVSYVFLIGTYWIYPTIHMTNNIIKNIAILLVGQPILFIFMVGFNLALVAIFILIACAIVYQIFKWIMEGN